MSTEIEALLLPLFRRQALPIGVTEAHKMLGCKQSRESVRVACVALKDKDLLIGIKKPSGMLYVINHAPKTRLETRSYEWRPLQPLRATVVPIRSGGRMAPDVSDGVYVSMLTRVEYYGRVDA